jgi:hypothetical protein
MRRQTFENGVFKLNGVRRKMGRSKFFEVKRTLIERMSENLLRSQRDDRVHLSSSQCGNATGEQ